MLACQAGADDANDLKQAITHIQACVRGHLVRHPRPQEQRGADGSEARPEEAALGAARRGKFAEEADESCFRAGEDYNDDFETDSDTSAQEEEATAGGVAEAQAADGAQQGQAAGRPARYSAEVQQQVVHALEIELLSELAHFAAPLLQPGGAQAPRVDAKQSLAGVDDPGAQALVGGGGGQPAMEQPMRDDVAEVHRATPQPLHQPVVDVSATACHHYVDQICDFVGSRERPAPGAGTGSVLNTQFYVELERSRADPASHCSHRAALAPALLQLSVLGKTHLCSSRRRR